MKKNLCICIFQLLLFQGTSQVLNGSQHDKRELNRAMILLKKDKVKKAYFLSGDLRQYDEIKKEDVFYVKAHYVFFRTNLAENNIDSSTKYDDLLNYKRLIDHTITTYTALPKKQAQKLEKRFELDRSDLNSIQKDIYRLLKYRRTLDSLGFSNHLYINKMKDVFSRIISDSTILGDMVAVFMKELENNPELKGMEDYSISYEIDGSTFYASFHGKYDTLSDGYGLGRYDDKKIDGLIQEFTNPILHLLLMRYQLKQTDFLINISTKGEADAHYPAGLKYDSKKMGQIKNQICFNVSAPRDTIRINLANKDPIDNFQLAFLRAYNAYVVFKNVIDDNIPVGKKSMASFLHYSTRFTAKNWIELDNTKLGSQYRKVEITLIIANLFDELPNNDHYSGTRVHIEKSGSEPATVIWKKE